MDWESAFNNCKKENAELVTILSSEESQFVNGQSIDVYKFPVVPFSFGAHITTDKNVYLDLINSAVARMWGFYLGANNISPNTDLLWIDGSNSNFS